MTPKTNEVEPEKLTVGKILRDLEPGQFWGLLVAAASVVASCFLLGQRFPVASAASTGANAAPVPCFRMTDWPQGRWWVWGRLNTPPTKKNTDNFTRLPQLVSEAVFTSNHSYEAQTEESTNDARKRAIIVQSNEPIVPGATVHLQGGSATGYNSTETLTVTDDGCLLNGTFGDNDGNAGSIHFLYESSRYYIPPK